MRQRLDLVRWLRGFLERREQPAVIEWLRQYERGRTVAQRSLTQGVRVSGHDDDLHFRSLPTRVARERSPIDERQVELRDHCLRYRRPTEAGEGSRAITHDIDVESVVAQQARQAITGAVVAIDEEHPTAVGLLRTVHGPVGSLQALCQPRCSAQRAWIRLFSRGWRRSPSSSRRRERQNCASAQFLRR